MLRIDRYDACSAFIPSAATSKCRLRLPPRCGVGSPTRDLHQALLFEPLERGVHRAHGDAAAAAFLDLGADGGAVGVGAEPQQREHDDLLELAEDGRRGARHGWRLISTMWINLSKC